MAESAQDIAATLAALGTYAWAVLPLRTERRRWCACAASIPDPTLRAQAFAALRDKSRDVEGTAVFATLAPRAARPRVVAAGVALQVAIDYLDSLGEAGADDPLGDGLRLHAALLGVVEPGVEDADPYRLHPHGDDGGYLGELVRSAATAAATLPRRQACAPYVEAGIRRCGEGQAQTHAAHLDLGAAIRSWGEGLTAPPGYQWREVAAGASSSVAAHALIALASDPGASAEASGLGDAAYFPAIGALTVLLDDLVDLDEDVAMGQHNYISYCENESRRRRSPRPARRMAESAIAPLPSPRRHRAILAGVLGFYLGDPAAGGTRARPARDRLLRTSGVSTRVLAIFSRL